MPPRGYKASSSSTDVGFDRWISTKVTYGQKRSREEVVESVTNPPSSQTNIAVATSSSSSANNNGRTDAVTVSLSIDEQHWLESLYTRACQNCLSHLGNEQSAQEEACIEARCSLDVDQQVHEQAFLKKLQRECAAKRKSMMTVRGPNSEDANAAIVIPKSLDFLSQFSASSATGGDGGDVFGGDCPFGDEDEFADATADNKDNDEGNGGDKENTKNGKGDDDDDKDGDEDTSKEVMLAKRAAEIDAAVETFKEERLAAFREDESKIRSEKEDGLVKEYPLGTLDGDEQSVLLLELGTIWRQKLAEIVNPGSALRRRIATDASYASGLVLGAHEYDGVGVGSRDVVKDDTAHLTGNCLRHLTQPSSNTNHSPFITANPDSAFLNLITEVAQRRIQAKMSQQQQHQGNEGFVSTKTETNASASSPPAHATAAATSTSTSSQVPLNKGMPFNDEDMPIAHLMANNNNSTFVQPKTTTSGTSSLQVFRRDTGLLDAMAQVARLQAQITAKEEVGAIGHQTPFQQVGWAQLMGQRNDAGRHFLSRCSGGVSSLPTSPTTPITTAASTLPPPPQPPTSPTVTVTQQDSAAPHHSGVGNNYNHLMRVSKKQLSIEAAVLQTASTQGVRAHLPCDFPDEFTIPLGEMDEEEVRLIEGNFRWPLPNLLVDRRSDAKSSETEVSTGVKHHNNNTAAANKKLEKKKKKLEQLARIEEESFGLRDSTRVDLQNAILRGIPTLSGGTIRRRGDDIIVSGGSVLTIPTISAQPQRGGSDISGEVALSSYVVSISLPGAL